MFYHMIPYVIHIIYTSYIQCIVYPHMIPSYTIIYSQTYNVPLVHCTCYFSIDHIHLIPFTFSQREPLPNSVNRRFFSWKTGRYWKKRTFHVILQHTQISNVNASFKKWWWNANLMHLKRCANTLIEFDVYINFIQYKYRKECTHPFRTYVQRANENVCGERERRNPLNFEHSPFEREWGILLIQKWWISSFNFTIKERRKRKFRN